MKLQKLTVFLLVTYCCPLFSQMQSPELVVEESDFPDLGAGVAINDHSLMVFDHRGSHVFDKLTGEFQFFHTPPILLGRYGESSDAYGELVAMGSPNTLVAREDGSIISGYVFVFNSVTGEDIHQLSFDYRTLDSTVGGRLGQDVAITDKYIAASDFGSLGVVFDVDSGEEIFRFQPENPTSARTPVDVHGDLFAIGARTRNELGETESSIFVFDLTTGEELLHLDDGNFSGVELGDGLVYTYQGDQIFAYDLTGEVQAVGDAGFVAGPAERLEYSPFGLANRSGLLDPITLEEKLFQDRGWFIADVHGDDFAFSTSVDSEFRVELHTIPEPAARCGLVAICVAMLGTRTRVRRSR